jgi:hypothetical protein
MAKPDLILDPEPALAQLGTRGSIDIGGLFGTVYAGQTVNAPEGKRFIWYADPTAVVFICEKKVYRQDGAAFREDVRTAPVIVGAQHAVGMARLGDAELKFLMGLLAGAHWAGFCFVIGSEIAEWVNENAENFDHWSIQLGALLKAREVFKGSCPKTYDIMFSRCLRKACGAVYDRLGQAATMEVIAFAIGVIVGHSGAAAYKGAFKIWLVISQSLQQIIIRTVLDVAPDAIGIASRNYQEIMTKALINIRSTGVAVSEVEIKLMINELAAHKREAKLAYDYIVAGFGKNR